MRKLKIVLASLCLSGLALFTSCNPNEDIAVDTGEQITPSTTAFQNIIEESLENHTQNFQFDGSVGNITLTSTNGVQININTNCLTLNGNPVTGTIDLEYIELFKKGDMLTTNKPTMGRLPNGDKALLISGGEFFIEAYQNGIPLETSCNLQLIVPSNLTGGPDPAMTLWEGEIDNEGNLTWDELDNTTGNAGVFVEGSDYIGILPTFGRTNIDRFYSDPRPKTQIQVKAPVGYNFSNSGVYLSYDGEDSGLAPLDTFDQVLDVFSEHYGQVPIGLECHVIFITEDNGNWRYAIKPVTIVANDIITFTIDDTNTITEADFANIINALP